MMSYLNSRIPVEASMDYPLYQSKYWNYYIGQTPLLTNIDGQAIVGLFNPPYSKTALYVNAITITNIAINSNGNNISAEFYLRSCYTPEKSSNLITSTNTIYNPFSNNNALILFQTSNVSVPSDGINMFTRISNPGSTLVVDGGQIILGPGQSLLIYLGGILPVNYDCIRIAFGWWEENLVSKNN